MVSFPNGTMLLLLFKTLALREQLVILMLSNNVILMTYLNNNLHAHSMQILTREVLLFLNMEISPFEGNPRIGNIKRIHMLI